MELSGILAVYINKQTGRAFLLASVVRSYFHHSNVSRFSLAVTHILGLLYNC